MAFPGTYNFSYYRGDTYQFVIRPKNSLGNPFNLAGYTATFKIANQRGAGATQYTGNASVDQTNMLVTCTISSTVGNTLAATNYVYDVEVTDGTNVYTLLTGTVAVTEQVSGAI